MTWRHCGSIALVAGALLVHGSVAAQAAEPSGQYCRRVGTDDTLRPIPALMVPDARRLLGLRAPGDVVRRTTVFRCMGHAVLVCNGGANLACGKANTDRDNVGAEGYCRENADSPSVPMAVTGHDTIYRWRCEGPRAVVTEGPAERVDGRGFLERLWKTQ